MNDGRLADAKRRLIVDVDASGQIRRLNDVDVVGWVLAGWGDSRRLYQAREAFAIAVDGRVNPIAHGDGRAGVWVGGVNCRGCLDTDGQKAVQKHGSCVGLHLDT